MTRSRNYRNNAKNSQRQRTPGRCLFVRGGQPSAAATVRADLQPGQLPAAGGIAPDRSSLDIDDLAGETDQDWGEGRAPFPEDSLPDGGGGGSESVVPRHPEVN